MGDDGDEVERVRRWQRYGHDRLYVTGPDGARWGYLDLRVGTAREVPDAVADRFGNAVDRWLAAHPHVLTPAREPAATSQAGAPSAPPAAPDTTSVMHRQTAVGDDPAAHLAAAATAPRSFPPALPPRTEPWHDLAANRPGQAVTAAAVARRRAAPVTSTLGRLLGIRTQESAWRAGALGELATAQALRPLTRPRWRTLLGRPPRWHVLHAVPVGTRGADIDHVLIGPAGVYTINTKHHRGARVSVGRDAVFVGGTTTAYAHKAISEATRAERLLTAANDGHYVRVRPIIAVVGATVTGRTSTTTGVLVLPADRIARHLRWRGRTLTADQVDALHDLARRSTTWQ